MKVTGTKARTGRGRLARLMVGLAAIPAFLLAGASGVVPTEDAGAIGGKTDEAIAVWQHRDSPTTTGWDIWYTVIGRATAGGPLSTQAGPGGASVAAPLAAPGGDDMNPFVSTNAGVNLAVWQHGHEGGDTDIVSSSFTVVNDEPVWSAMSTVSGGGERDLDPAVAVDSNGDAITVYVHEHSPAGTGTREVMSRIYDSATNTWSAPQSIGATGGQASLPELAITSVAAVAGSELAHRVVAAWSDFSDGTHRIFAARFDGTSWTTPIQVESATTGISTAINNVGFSDYPLGNPEALDRMTVAGDAQGRAYVMWGGPSGQSPGVVGAILDVSANTWSAMLTPGGSRFIGIGGCQNPDAGLTTGVGEMIAVFDFAGFIEHTRRITGSGGELQFTPENVSYDSDLDDVRPSNAAVSATEMLSMNWGTDGTGESDVVWSVGTPTGTSGVTWSPTSGTRITLAGEDRTPELASGFAAALVTGFTLTPSSATATVGGTHTVTAKATQNGMPQAGVEVTFTISGANPGSFTVTTDSAGEATLTYTGTNPGTDTITATATVGGVAQSATATVVWSAAGADNVPPVTTPAQTPAPNANGWNNTDVQVTLTAVDFAPAGVTPSGVNHITADVNFAPVACPMGDTCTFTITAEGHHHVHFHATDNAGNMEAAKEYEVFIDKTPPLITATHTPPADADGDNFTDVTKSYECEDAPSIAPSGIDTCSPPTTITQEGTHVVTGTAVDKAGNQTVHTQTVVIKRPRFLVIDQDSIDAGAAPNFFSAQSVNKHIARVGLRTPLPAFAAGTTLTLRTGQVGDEGMYALKTIPGSWNTAGPTADGLRNYVLAGPGLGSGRNRERFLDKVPDVTPLRADGLGLLAGRFVCAVVYDSDISVNFGPLTGSLKGANLGIVAFKVTNVTPLSGSTSTLPAIELRTLDAQQVCGAELRLLTEAPAPSS